MPQEFTMETLPEPNDPRVHILEISERKVAVYRYSGTWSEERYLENSKKFVSVLEQSGVVTTGEPLFARYNPPFMPWFLRRNEILFEVAVEK